MAEEWGSTGPIGFWEPKLYDGDGNEIIVPKCKGCQTSMGQIIGKESFMWVCMYCDGEGNVPKPSKFIYRPAPNLSEDTL
jgi:hypothetical protein